MTLEDMDIASLKKMTRRELEKLAEQIRACIIQTVAKNGGHLASNLGVVELTIALHRVFDSPADRIIWDVGHQCYVHKLLTGRGAQFASLRTLDGISGFPKRGESEHDVFETGHSSTAISAASGMARARDLRGENYQIVAVVGDGALTGGICYEGLNDIGHGQQKVIVILNDNEMSISRNVGAMASYLMKIRTNRRYRGAKVMTKSVLAHMKFIGRPIYWLIDRFKTGFKYLLVKGIFFEEIGFTYLGPVDGHDILALSEVMNKAKELSTPVFIHVITKKGKGFAEAELSPEHFHGIAPFYMESPQYGPNKPGYSQTTGKTLIDLAHQDARVVAITAAMPNGTGLSCFAQAFPARFFDVGITEPHAVIMAAGMAREGMRPFVAVYSTFLQRAYDPILHDVCRQSLPVVFCVDHCGLVGEDGDTHQGVFDISYLQHIPGLWIASPCNEMELSGIMRLSLEHDIPLAIRYPRGTSSLEVEAMPMRWGRWETVRQGRDGCLIAVGSMLKTALEAADMLAQKGRLLRVIYARFVKPIDKQCLKELNCHRIFTLEDNVVAGGFGSAVREAMQSLQKDTPVHCFGIPDCFIEHGHVDLLYQKLGLSAQSIAQQIGQCLGWGG